MTPNSESGQFHAQQPSCHYSILELPGLLHLLLDFANFFLVDKEEVTRLLEACDLSGKRKVVDVFQHVVEPRSFISAVLEMPKVIVCVLGVFSLIMIRECVKRSTILTLVSRYDADDVWVWTHDNLGIPCWDASPFTVSNDTGDEVSPAVDVES